MPRLVRPSHPRESLTGRLVMFVCSIILTLVILAGVIVLILWLSLRPHRPHFDLNAFSISGLSATSGLQTPTVTFDVTRSNPNRKIVIHYGSMDATLYYNDVIDVGGAPVAPPMEQHPKNVTVLHGELTGASLTAGDEQWGRFSSELGSGRVLFRLDLNSTIRFELSTWDTRTHVLHVSCDAGVGTDGALLMEYKDQRCSTYFG